MADIIQNKDLNKQGVPSTLGQPPQISRLKPLGGPTSSGQFTNLSKVIGANQNNKLGSTISGNVQNVAEKTNTGANQAFQGFQTEAQKNALDTAENQQKRQTVLNQYGVDAQNAQGPSDQDVATFDKFRSGKYQGPTSLANADQIQAQANEIGNLRQGFNTEQGRIGVLQRFLGNRNYTAGQKKLDSTLLGGAGSAQVRSGLQGAIANANEAQKTVGAANLLGQDLTERAKAFGAQTNDMIGQTRSADQSAIDANVKQAETDKTAKIQRIKDAISGTGNAVLSEQDLKDLGVTEGQDVFSDYAQALNASNTAATAQNVAKANDYTKFQALSKLAGMNEEQYTDPTQAGKFFEGQVSLDPTMVNALRQQHLEQVKQSLGPNLQWYLSAKRNEALASDPVSRARNFGVGPFSMGPDVNQERRIQQDTKNSINQMLASQGFQGTDLDSVFGNLDVNNQNDWYNAYQNTGADQLISRLVGTRKFTKQG